MSLITERPTSFGSELNTVISFNDEQDAISRIASRIFNILTVGTSALSIYFIARLPPISYYLPPLQSSTAAIVTLVVAWCFSLVANDQYRAARTEHSEYIRVHQTAFHRLMQSLTGGAGPTRERLMIDSDGKITNEASHQYFLEYGRLFRACKIDPSIICDSNEELEKMIKAIKRYFPNMLKVTIAELENLAEADLTPLAELALDSLKIQNCQISSANITQLGGLFSPQRQGISINDCHSALDGLNLGIRCSGGFNCPAKVEWENGAITFTSYGDGKVYVADGDDEASELVEGNDALRTHISHLGGSLLLNNIRELPDSSEAFSVHLGLTIN